MGYIIVGVRRGGGKVYWDGRRFVQKLARVYKSQREARAAIKCISDASVESVELLPIATRPADTFVPLP